MMVKARMLMWKLKHYSIRKLTVIVREEESTNLTMSDYRRSRHIVVEQKW